MSPTIPKKRIIICCDGTWQASNHGLATSPSNVAKISRAIAKYDTTNESEVVPQVVFYHAGVGTAVDSVKGQGMVTDFMASIVQKFEGGLGAGLDENVNEVYGFIANNYVPGDELYFFGFSRGAYTARAAAGLVARIGVCENPMLDSFHNMYKAYKSKKADEPIEETKWAKEEGGWAWLDGCHKNPIIKVVGVFDTVGSLGFPDTGKVDVSKWNAMYGFHNTSIHPEIEYAFHALALDEHRRPFGPTLWSLPANPVADSRTKKLIQCWFPGMHINIGGGSSDVIDKDKSAGTDFEAMANITYAWMVDRVRENTGLVFDSQAVHDIVLRYSDAVYSIEGIDDKRKGKRAFGGWGMGPVADSIEGMKLGGSATRTPGQYPEKGQTEEYIHPVVAYATRPDAPSKYATAALEGFVRTKRVNGPGHDWVKTFEIPQGEADNRWFSYFRGKPAKPEGKKVTVTVPEFIIPGEDESHSNSERWIIKASSEHQQQGFAPPGSAEADLHVKREEAFRAMSEFMMKLDVDNQVKNWQPTFVNDPSSGFSSSGFQ